MVIARVALAEDLGLIPGPQVVSHSHSSGSVSEDLLPSSGLCRHEAYT